MMVAHGESSECPLPEERIPRRRVLGAAATLSAARILAPSLFVGCSLGVPPNRSRVLVGLMHSQTGPLAISATSLRDIQLHAIERINADGGVLGHLIDVKAPDTRSRNDLFVKRSRQLLDSGAAALFGCWTSASRKAVLPIVEDYRKLLFYAVQYEGNESSKYIVYGGMVPNQQILPAIDWLIGDQGGARKKIFLVGSDYVYPRTANYIATKYLQSIGLEPVGEAYVPLGDRDFTAIVEEIRASGADAVLNTVNGDSNIGLFAALADGAINPAKVPVVSTSLAEDELRSLLPEQVRGHYAAACSFQSLDTEANRSWVKGFRDEFGYDRVAGGPMEPGWCLVHLWKRAVEKAGSFETEAVRQAFREGLSFAGPGGTVRLDPKTQHTTKHFRLGRIRADRQFDVVHQSNGPIDPDPYPQIAFPGWSCDWTKDGIVHGPEVDIDGDV
ncbi:MAG: urea ABC transporter substrate-binding protein [Planctomycetia bacterium]